MFCIVHFLNCKYCTYHEIFCSLLIICNCLFINEYKFILFKDEFTFYTINVLLVKFEMSKNGVSLSKLF